MVRPHSVGNAARGAPDQIVLVRYIDHCVGRGRCWGGLVYDARVAFKGDIVLDTDLVLSVAVPLCNL